jgi:hypothetical protein
MDRGGILSIFLSRMFPILQTKHSQAEGNGFYTSPNATKRQTKSRKQTRKKEGKRQRKGKPFSKQKFSFFLDQE